jgi:hypothetical protein
MTRRARPPLCGLRRVIDATCGSYGDIVRDTRGASSTASVSRAGAYATEAIGIHAVFGACREWLNSGGRPSPSSERTHTNGGRDARLRRGDSLRVPDYGVVVLQRA